MFCGWVHGRSKWLARLRRESMDNAADVGEDLRPENDPHHPETEDAVAAPTVEDLTSTREKKNAGQGQPVNAPGRLAHRDWKTPGSSPGTSSTPETAIGYSSHPPDMGDSSIRPGTTTRRLSRPRLGHRRWSFGRRRWSRTRGTSPELVCSPKTGPPEMGVPR
jgi:hypothetical protein